MRKKETVGEFVYNMLNEMLCAREKHPGRAHLLAALMEEVGELAKALLEGEPHERVWAEATQVACVAARIATEGDADFDRFAEQMPSDDGFLVGRDPGDENDFGGAP